MKRGICGSLESNDCLITVEEAETLEITIQSIVYDQFSEAIEQAIRECLEEMNYTNVRLFCNDKGALDYTIKARVKTALQRMEKSI